MTHARTKLVVHLWRDLDTRVGSAALEATRLMLIQNSALALELLHIDVLHEAAFSLLEARSNSPDFLHRASVFQIALALGDLTPCSKFLLSSTVWAAIQSSCESMQTELQVAAIEAAGATIGASLSELDSVPRLPALEDWLRWLNSFTLDSMSPALRLACCESLRRAKLLHATDTRFDRARLSAWCASIALMQDESELVRVRAAFIVHRALPKESRLASNLQAADQANFSAAHPTTVSHCIEASCAQLDQFHVVDVALAINRILSIDSQYSQRSCVH